MSSKSGARKSDGADFKYDDDDEKKPSIELNDATIKIPIRSTSANSESNDVDRSLYRANSFEREMKQGSDAKSSSVTPSASEATTLLRKTAGPATRTGSGTLSGGAILPNDEVRHNGARSPGKSTFTVTQVPPLSLLVLLACQHALTLLGGLVLVPLTIVPLMGGTTKQAAEMIGTVYFVTGLNTLLQTIIGNRLPIVQVTSFSYLPPTLAIIYHPSLQAISDSQERFSQTMEVLSGSILVAGVVECLLGYTGILVPLLRFVSPVTITCVTTAIGLGYYNVAFAKVATCYPMGITMIFLGVTLSQMLSPSSPTPETRKVQSPSRDIPQQHQGQTTLDLVTNLTQQNLPSSPWMKRLRESLSLLPLLLAITMTWLLSAILTAFDVWEENNECRTDGARDVIGQMPFFRIPYPGQWGGFRFESFGIIPMFGAVLASMIESVGDYYTCARVSGAPPPTPGIISRGLGTEGLGVIMDGLFGKGAGSTSSSGDIAIVALTGVGSRSVIQMTAIVLMIVGTMGKITALVASLPSGIVGGVFCIVLGSLVAVGLTNLQFVSLGSYDINSKRKVKNFHDDRNIFIIGFAIFNCLSLAGPGGFFSSRGRNYDIQSDFDFNETTDLSLFGDGPIGQIALAMVSSPMVIAVLIALVLDNTIPGTDRQRGLNAWARARIQDASLLRTDPEYRKTYSLPYWIERVVIDPIKNIFSSCNPFPHMMTRRKSSYDNNATTNDSNQRQEQIRLERGQNTGGQGDLWELWTRRERHD